MVPLISRAVMFPLMEARDPYKRHALARQLARDQWLPSAELAARQAVRLRDILAYAATHCAYYQRTFQEVSFDPQSASLPGDLARLPILTKDLVRAHGDALHSMEYSEGQLVESRTGGSTGVSLRIFADRACQAARNAAAMRSDGWAGWVPGMTMAALWGNPPAMSSLRESVRNTFYDRLVFLDTMDMTPSRMRAFTDRCRREAPFVLFGHAHSLFLYAQFLAEAGVQPPRPAGIISTSMMLPDSERAVIEKVFNRAVSNRYGCEEVGLIASECEVHDGLHVNVDHVHLEVVDDRLKPVPPGVEGQLVVTDLVNRGQPLIRYLVGDMGVMSERPCRCGRGQPLLERLSGRVADFLRRRDGSRVAGISLIERTLTAIPGVKQMQIIQESLDRIVLNVVADEAWSARSEDALRDEFREVFGDPLRVEIAPVGRIEPLPSGKYRFSICKVGAAGAEAKS